MSKIKSEDISVVVQGVVDPVLTKKCLKSIRKYLPKAELILSTWEGTDVSNLEYDVVIFNKDPGPSGLVRKYPVEQINNVNRQIISTINGIKKTSKNYVLKIRSDMLLVGNGFLSYYNLFGKFVKNSFFKQRILIESTTTSTTFMFCVGDWYSFGLKEDMLKLWDIKLYPNESEKEFFLTEKHKNERPFLSDVICQYSPEQWIAYQCYLKFKKIDFKHFYDFNKNVLNETETFIRNNFLTADICFSNIILPKASKNICKVTPSKNYLNFQRQLKILEREFGKIIPFYQRIYMKFRSKLCEKDFSYKTLLSNVYIVSNYLKKSKSVEMKFEDFTEKDISFVVSGKLDKKAIKNILKLRKKYRRSKIILVVSSENDVSSLTQVCDKIIYVDIRDDYFLDYMAQLKENSIQKPFTYNKQQNEINIGLKSVDTKYACRFRADFDIGGCNIVKLYKILLKKFGKTNKEACFVKQKVLVPNFITGDGRINCYHNFTLSDCFMFGLKDDLLKFYSATLVSLDDILFFEKKENRNLLNPYLFNHRYCNEQSFWINTLKNQNIKINFPQYYSDCSTDMIFENEKYIASNLIVISFNKMGLKTKFNQSCLEGLKYKRFLEIYILCVDQKNEKLIYEYKKCVHDQFIDQKSLDIKIEVMDDLKKIIEPFNYLRICASFLKKIFLLSFIQVKKLGGKS